MAIVRLTEALKRKIAAGEVIERPASVLKELVENAIDAASERTEIELTAGGTASIVVRDDGVGMDEEDLRLCVERYATSKIRTEDDLDRIDTFAWDDPRPMMAELRRLMRTVFNRCPAPRDPHQTQ